MREPTPAPLVLLADAAEQRRTFLADNLTADGHAVTCAATAEHARHQLASARPWLLVLGPLDTAAAAVELVRELRAERPALPLDPYLPVICLGPAGDELAELRALHAGADDWLALPLSYPLLLARIAALVRRTRQPGRLGALRVGRLELDPSARAVHVSGQPVELTNHEFLLLARLASEPTRVFTKQQLLGELWGMPAGLRTRTLDSHACRLRSKLALAGAPRHIANVWGVGYRLLSPVDAPEHNGSAA